MDIIDVLVIVFILIPTLAIALLGTLCLHTEYALMRAKQVNQELMAVWTSDDDETHVPSVLDYTKTTKV